MSMSEFITRPNTNTATAIDSNAVFNDGREVVEVVEPAVGSGYQTGVTSSGVSPVVVEPAVGGSDVVVEPVVATSGVGSGVGGPSVSFVEPVVGTGVNSGVVGSGVHPTGSGVNTGVDTGVYTGGNTGVGSGVVGSGVYPTGTNNVVGSGVYPTGTTGLGGSGVQTVQTGTTGLGGSGVGLGGSGTPVYSAPTAPIYAPSSAGGYPTTPYSAQQTTVTYQTGAAPLSGSQVQYGGGVPVYEAAVIPGNAQGNTAILNTSSTQGVYDHVRAAPVHTHYAEQEVVEVVPVVVVPPISTLTVSDAQKVNYGQNPQSVENRWRNRLNAITMAHNAHEQQNQYYQKLVTRHEFNVNQTGNLKGFFEKRAEASKAFAKALNALPKMHNNEYGQPIPHHGSLESILERVNEVTLTEASVHQKFGDSIDTHNAEKFTKLHNSTKTAHTTLTDGYKHHNRRLGQLRQNADRSLNQWSSNASIPAGEHYKPAYDPWLRETRFLHHFTNYRNGLDDYNNFLHSSFQRTHELDNQRVELLKAALIEVLRLQQSLVVNQLNAAIETGLGAIDSPTIGPDFHKYAYSSGLTKISHDDPTTLSNNFHSNLPRGYRTDALDVADDFDYYAYKRMGTPAPLHHANYVPTSDYSGEVEHMGQLDMSSRKGSTKPYLWVLSKYGYLHQFSAAGLEKPKMSVAAKYCSVTPADAHGDFKIDYKQPGLHTRHNFYVRAANQAEGQLWAQKINAAGQRATYNY